MYDLTTLETLKVGDKFLLAMSEIGGEFEVIQEARKILPSVVYVRRIGAEKCNMVMGRSPVLINYKEVGATH